MTNKISSRRMQVWVQNQWLEVIGEHAEGKDNIFQNYVQGNKDTNVDMWMKTKISNLIF